MGYTFEIEAIISYVEERVKQKIDFSELERTLNYSYRHIRGIFKRETDISLSRYILSRKIAYCAKEILESSKTLTEIAYEYNVGSYDTFSRAFKRETGVQPSAFKQSPYECGIKHICMGIYAPSIIYNGKHTSNLKMDNIVERTHQEQDSCILYGVSKVHYGRAVKDGLQFTPFPMCLEVVLSYLGQKAYYSHIMAATGASFRLTWNADTWDLRAVDERNIFSEPYKAFELAFKSVGRASNILGKDSGSLTKKDFIRLIKDEIDKGNPVLALGVVGPPDASIITGYKKNGEVLLGWSLVQEHLEFKKDITFDESGYFECGNWWQHTEVLMLIGDHIDEKLSLKNIFENAYDVLNGDMKFTNERGTFYTGQEAYKAIIRVLLDDKEFPSCAQYSMLIEKILAFRDAISMIWDGRSYAAGYIRWIGKTNLVISDECNMCADYLVKIVRRCSNISDMLEGLSGEISAFRLADKSIRQKVISEIELAREYEVEVSKCLKVIIGLL